MVAVSLKKIFFKQKTAYEIQIRDWSSDVCSSDLNDLGGYDENDNYYFRFNSNPMGNKYSIHGTIG